MKSMKRICNVVIQILAPLGTIALCIIALFIIAITGTMPFHNYRLWMMQKQFRSAMQAVNPAQSELRAEMKEFGNFGNSNHCDYFVGEFRSSPLSKEELLQRYASVATSSFVGNRLIEIGVYFIDADIFTGYPWSEWLEKYLPDKKHITNQNTYLIFSEDADNPPDGDIRCN